VETECSRGLQRGAGVIVDLRTYTMVPGRLQRFLELYEAEGFPVQKRHQGEPIAYFVTEIGPNNQVVHLWAYQSMADRETRRAALAKDPDWIAYRAKSAREGNVQYQEDKIVRPTSFSPLR
jgi:hypothetical protein